MSAETLRRLSLAVRTLGRLTRALGHLPAADVSIRDEYDGDAFVPTVIISVHDTPADFEAWREALEIDAADVTSTVLPSALVLKCATRWHGTPVKVQGYGPGVTA